MSADDERKAREARSSRWPYGPLRQDSERLLWPSGPSEWTLVIAQVHCDGSVATDAYIRHDDGARVPEGRGELERVPRLLEIAGLRRQPV